jgi:hypothetical protein
MIIASSNDRVRRVLTLLMGPPLWGGEGTHRDHLITGEQALGGRPGATVNGQREVNGT